MSIVSTQLGEFTLRSGDKDFIERNKQVVNLI